MVSTMPPVPKLESRLPSVLYRATPASPIPWLLGIDPPTTILPSLWMAAALAMALSWPLKTVVTIPPLPKVGSKLPAWAINKVEEQRNAGPTISAIRSMTTDLNLPARTVISRLGAEESFKTATLFMTFSCL